MYFTGQFLWQFPDNHHRLQASRFTKNNQLFHREHGCLRSAFPVGCNACVYNCISDQLRALACQWNLRINFASCFISVARLSFLFLFKAWRAIDRFVAVVFPIKIGLISSKIRTIAIVSTWVLAQWCFLFSIACIVIHGLVERGNDAFCGSLIKHTIDFS